MNPFIAIGVLCLLFFFILRMIAGRKARSPLGPSPISTGQRKEVEKSLDDVFLQLQEFSRETLAKLDTRVRMLNQLVIDADERIKRLEALKSAQPGPGAAVVPPPPPPPADPPVDPLHDRIYRLLDGGSSLTDISKEVGLPKGEVELIAGLRGLPRPGG